MRTAFVLMTCIAVLALAAGCHTGGTKRVDPDLDDKLGGTGLDSADARTIGSWMARSLIDNIEGRVPAGATVAILEVRNETRFFIDSGLLARKVETEIMRGAPGRLTFLARDRIEDIMREREGKRTGPFEDHKALGKLLGAQYFLTGEIRAISKARRADRSDYVETFFELIDAETSVKIWQDSHEFKKVGKAGTIYR